MLPKRYFIDDRVFKDGKRNPFLNLATTKELNDLVYQIVYGTAPGTQTGPLLIQNGLTDTLTPQNFIIELGGDLTRNTTIVGNTFNFIFNGIGTFQITNTTLVDIEATTGIDIRTDGALNLVGVTQFTVHTPNVATATANIGDILTLSNATVGDCDWVPLIKGAFDDDAAAGVGGLITGDIYQTTGVAANPLNVAGIVMVKQ